MKAIGIAFSVTIVTALVKMVDTLVSAVVTKLVAFSIKYTSLSQRFI
jgi:hypothetical protein